jgi:hypothetical protein
MIDRKENEVNYRIFEESEIYEGFGPLPARKERTMRNEESGTRTHGGRHEPGGGYEAWLARREERASDLSRDDVAYEQYVARATGEAAQERAGVAESGFADVGRVDLSEDNDEAVMADYLAEQSGEAARKRTEEAARQEREDRIQEHRRHSRELGYPAPELYRGDDGPDAA